MKYIEVELENKNMGKRLQNYTKISPGCVMNCHPGIFWVTKHNTTSNCHPISQNPAPLIHKEVENDNDDNTDDDKETEEFVDGDIWDDIKA